MAYLYLKSVHIIFVVSWFAALFYIVRLYIYHTEAFDKPSPEKEILQKQFSIMEKRLMNIIGTPAMILTIITGSVLIYINPGMLQGWMHIKLSFVALLIAYHFYCLHIQKKLNQGIIVLSSTQLRLWNELATLFLVAIVFLVVAKNMVSPWWGMLILIGLGVVLGIAVKLYKRHRSKISNE